MTKPRLIVFAEDWGAHPSSTQHLMTYLAEHFEVLWINSIGLRRPRLNARDVRRLGQKLLAKWRGGLSTTPQKVQVTPFTCISPWLVPLPKSSFWRRLNQRWLRWQLAGHLVGDQPVWVWTSLPSAVDYIGCFNEQGWVYYCGDDFGALAGVDHEIVLQREQQLARHVAQIWCASDSLTERFKAQTRNVPIQYLPHGVDFSLFSRAVSPAPAVPQTGPVLGFYGALADWIDQDLLLRIAQGLPHWRIMLVGPMLVEHERLQQQSNIQCLPAVAHEQLPRYVQHWTAAILPFHDNAQIRACNPLKLREYLASGTPILATPFPALAPYQQHVYTIKKSSDAIAVLQQLENHEEAVGLRQARQQSVAGESWQARAQAVLADLARIGAIAK